MREQRTESLAKQRSSPQSNSLKPLKVAQGKSCNYCLVVPVGNLTNLPTGGLLLKVVIWKQMMRTLLSAPSVHFFLQERGKGKTVLSGMCVHRDAQTREGSDDAKKEKIPQLAATCAFCTRLYCTALLCQRVLIARTTECSASSMTHGCLMS